MTEYAPRGLFGLLTPQANTTAEPTVGAGPDRDDPGPNRPIDPIWPGGLGTPARNKARSAAGRAPARPHGLALWPPARDARAERWRGCHKARRSEVGPRHPPGRHPPGFRCAGGASAGSVESIDVPGDRIRGLGNLLCRTVAHSARWPITEAPLRTGTDLPPVPVPGVKDEDGR